MMTVVDICRQAASDGPASNCDAINRISTCLVERFYEASEALVHDTALSEAHFEIVARFYEARNALVPDTVRPPYFEVGVHWFDSSLNLH